MHSSDGVLVSCFILVSCSPASHVSISVGNGSHISVMSRGHSILTTPASKFALNNVLIVPSIVRNLLPVRQFTFDNNCLIEFDALGFSMKDFRTKRVILRCNSDGDLYTISATTPSTAQALLAASPSLWHQRLGHSGPATISSLRNSHYIACHKIYRTICHACCLANMLVSPSPLLVHILFLLLRLFIVMFGHLQFLASQATLIIWLCWMIFLTFAGLFLSIESLMCMVTWLISLLTLAHNLAFVTNASRLIMALSSLTSPPYPTWRLMDLVSTLLSLHLTPKRQGQACSSYSQQLCAHTSHSYIHTAPY